MGFMASAFAGGLAKGYLQGKEQRRQDAVAERELKIREDDLALRREIMAQDQLNNNLTMKLQNQEVKQDQYDSEGLVRAGSGFRFTAAGDTESSPYMHFAPKKGKGDKLDYEKTNFLNLQRLNNELQGPDAAAVKQSIADNPDVWAGLVTRYYDGTSKFQGNLDDGELMRMYMLRLSPLSAEEMENKKTKDMTTFNPLLEAFGNLGADFDNKSLTDYIKERNQLQLRNAHKKSDGSFAFYRHKDGSVSLVKNDAVSVNGVKINQEQKKALNKIGTIDFSNPKNTSFNNIISVAQGLDQIKVVNEGTKAGASALFMEDSLGFTDVADLGSNVTSDSKQMGTLYNETKNIFSEVIKENDKGYIPLGARKAMTDSLGLAFYVKVLAKDTIVVDSTNNLTTARIKPTFLEGKAAPKTIANANATVETATTGIENIQYMLNLQQGIPVEFLKSGQALSSSFDVFYRITKGASNLQEFFTTDFFKSKLNQNNRNVITKKLTEVDKTIGDLKDKGFNPLTADGELGGTLKNIERDYADNVAALMDAQANGDILEAAGGKQNVADQIFEARMEIEASKIRLAFKLASLVQGGGSGGGRTISNADFEVIYNSLYRSGTGKTLTNALLRVRHELLKSQVRAENILNYGGVGVHAQVSAVTDAYLDRAYSESNGLMRNGVSYVYNSKGTINERIADIQDIEATSAKFPEQATIKNSNFSTMTDQSILDFGLSKEDPQFNELSKLSSQQDFSIPFSSLRGADKINRENYQDMIADYVLPKATAELFDMSQYGPTSEDPFKEQFELLKKNYNNAQPDQLRTAFGDSRLLSVLDDMEKTFSNVLQLNVRGEDFETIGPNIPKEVADVLVKKFMYKRTEDENKNEDYSRKNGISDEFFKLLIDRLNQQN